MKITKIKTQVKHIELKTPFKTALRTATHVEFVRVCVIDENGFIGVGEAPATKAITGEDIEIILNSIESVREQFLNLTCKEALELLHFTCKIGSGAKAALDMAFVHLLSQEAKKPLYGYFGATELTPLKTDVTISLNEAAVMLSDAKKAYDNAMTILKVKVGKDILHAIEVVKKISKELPQSEILVDANQAWSLEDSLLFIRNMKDVKIELIEQPVIASDLEGLKKITQLSHIPILADEAAFGLADVKKVVESQSANMINIKFMKCGGVTKAIEILEYAREKKVTCMLGSMLEGPYSINMALHLALAYRDVIRYIDLDSPLLYKEPSDELDFEFSGCEINLYAY
ncbi:MAG: dipeptide epimerase [Sulfurimonas sp. RIFCSPHIGHO2_12_FULL_36_9]|uniref:dipeptide epimerase n=1 Tax=Sulfurimonas sp. RIFCSPLOWO2_12_36_12 TaxID=1802253 RepID=UPI0008B39C7F|nr:dipeptide epimerase [Sulfurimonas sp. RIFCSPLOWO2_12_36_12]OHD96607.1 MAG: dipeptide epimerase [Sulfurimonas sp. RIFCSPHIGHO2_12_FULL_36_9]OHD99312.1 MAG: dipeptide epimerase [Sulfurimonas sp. RIFCSPLOWO2_02_FULL_36_28]OHE01255.1 MAG: dipeptide epimerase [Sulfurimonas sp. RIFCSPLOWO2_12_36_12]OHE04985.1 MAG: dipeptide epimerase [Sulfurimonas sp. RIFCSPLOWO2_12_FULL_36_74]